jgi:hypothetical protein
MPQKIQHLCRVTQKQNRKIEFKNLFSNLSLTSFKTVADPFFPFLSPSLSNILAGTATGLTGSEIGSLLNTCGINDPSPGITKELRDNKLPESDVCSRVYFVVPVTMEFVSFDDALRQLGIVNFNSFFVDLLIKPGMNFQS